MKDTTSGSDIEVFRFTPMKPNAFTDGAWYDAWACSTCAFPLTLPANQHAEPGPIVHLEPAGGHVRAACPNCGTDRLYAINDRQMIQWRAR
jgi:hypothetical protein